MNLPERADDEVRIGVSITVPEPWGTLLQDARAGFGDPAAEQIPSHITLLGPTVVAPERLVEIDAHLREVAASHEPFTVRLRGTGSFRPVSSVVFVQVVEGIAGCERLESDVRSGPLEQGLRFNYHPHVTVAHEVPDERLDAAFDGLADFDASFLVTLIHSYEHGDDGVWRPARDYPLGGRSAGPTGGTAADGTSAA
ncbi:2'-5' RNA ligase family protein [Cellulomonas soli]|uniref:Phosphoesterase n=1 Tax=Cellulomonas soli TaxID=931535 RepID=A0A512PFX0_9CELL|nr:2'-5' RNA ligase family protein [Cellulomonas soli]NYI59814.1 2'-5' RNA ligase [Cellulomonas soli]GEP70042.1 phosphoesterase [Cellulomonas soli]